MTQQTKIELELPEVPGALEFLDELGRLLGMIRLEDGRALRLATRRPEAGSPAIELRLASGPRARLSLVSEGERIALGFAFDASAVDAFREGRRFELAPDTVAEAIELRAVREALGAAIRSVDHMGLNLPSISHQRDRWRSALGAVAAHAAVLPYDEEAEIAFVVPTTHEERAHGIGDPDRPRKPKLELVRDAFLELPMIGFAVDTDLSLEALEAAFPEPIGVARPGNEAFFRSVLLVQPWTELIFSLDLNSASTSEIEITRILVDGAARLPA